MRAAVLIYGSKCNSSCLKVQHCLIRANVGKYPESQISSKNLNFSSYHPNNPLGELFQEMILRNPQALYILRNLEKFSKIR